MIAGLVLIAASMVAGGLALAAADHTVAYWAVSSGVHEGERVERSDFTVAKVKVPERTARTLIRTDAALPHRLEQLVWSRSLPAGSLVSVPDLEAARSMVEVPVTVGAGGVPADLRRGDVVDVWASVDDPTGDDAGAAAATKAVKILSRVRVVSRANAGGLDGGPATTVVVDAAGATVDGHLVGAVSTGHITLVRVS
jgi:hypothetical protein